MSAPYWKSDAIFIIGDAKYPYFNLFDMFSLKIPKLQARPSPPPPRIVEIFFHDKGCRALLNKESFLLRIDPTLCSEHIQKWEIPWTHRGNEKVARFYAAGRIFKLEKLNFANRFGIDWRHFSLDTEIQRHIYYCLKNTEKIEWLNSYWYICLQWRGHVSRMTTDEVQLVK